MDALLIVLFAWLYKNEISNWISNAVAEGIRRNKKWTLKSNEHQD